MEKLEGVLERITYYNEETCYLVGKVKSGRARELVTVVGPVLSPVVGENMDLTGEWVIHPEYGRQFKIDRCDRKAPTSLKGIERYLASGLIKGIGPSTAKLLVDHFQEEALRVIEEEPERLVEVPGIGGKKAETIAESYKKQQAMQDVVLFFQEYGVSPSYAARIYRQLGEGTIPLVEEDPYLLAETVMGVGFKTADMIACKMGLAVNSPQRVKASLEYILSRATEEGHVFLPREKLAARALELLEGEDPEALESIVHQQMRELVQAQKLIIETKDQEECCYLAPFFFAERGVAARLQSLSSRQITLETTSLEVEISDIEKACNIQLAPRQREALEQALDAGVLVLTGGPGTGKTTTINALLEMFRHFHLEVLLAAPTGRAAKRMAEATGREAKTIHRLLEFSRMEGEGFRFKKNEDNPLRAHVVIVDEVSMVDILLMYNLLKALPAGCKLILVGDVDQLPSVGPGNVLKDIIESGVVPVTRLETIFRQAGGSSIIVNAHRINGGEMPYAKNDRAGDFFFMNKEEPEDILRLILDLCARRLPKYQEYNPFEDIQVLTPMHRTLLGVENLNQNLQERLNPPSPAKPELKLGGLTFRLGDKVMQIKNNYDLEVFNGDIGRLTYLDREEGQAIIAYPDVRGYREVIYNMQDMDEVVLAYATSVHKSQGSEYKVVVLPVVTQHYIMLQRNLLYTAVTRAREMVILIGTKRALAMAVKNVKVEERHTLLAARLQ